MIHVSKPVPPARLGTYGTYPICQVGGIVHPSTLGK
ncbi:hypothetical protein Q3G72_027574 [Acer saccharum]|nr:hypothetical protein Q3G72_027574 [Acer saccharum]